MTTINYNGKELTLDYDAQIDNYSDGVAFFAKAHDDQGTAYSIRWDYIEPSYDCGNDLSDCADWEHPAEVIEL